MIAETEQILPAPDAAPPRQQLNTVGAHVEALNVINVTPVWAQADMVRLVTGLPKHYLMRFVAMGLIRCKKGSALTARSLALYNVADALRCVESLPDATTVGNPDEDGAGEEA